MEWVIGIISLGGVVGLATTLLMGLYAQSRIYLGLARYVTLRCLTLLTRLRLTHLPHVAHRDKLAPSCLAKLHPQYKTPVNAQLLCCGVASGLALLLNVRVLTEILDIGVLLGYATVCGSLLVLRNEAQRATTIRYLGLLVVVVSMACLAARLRAPPQLQLLLLVLVMVSMLPFFLVMRFPPEGGAFQCPLVPLVPLLGLTLDIYLAFCLAPLAWLRLLVSSVLLVAYYVYAERRRLQETGGMIQRGGARGADGGQVWSSPGLIRRRRAPLDDAH
jgi:APA family basic amino acid/polyamine antiporter